MSIVMVLWMGTIQSGEVIPKINLQLGHDHVASYLCLAAVAFIRWSCVRACIDRGRTRAQQDSKLITPAILSAGASIYTWCYPSSWWYKHASNFRLIYLIGIRFWTRYIDDVAGVVLRS